MFIEDSKQEHIRTQKLKTKLLKLEKTARSLRDKILELEKKYQNTTHIKEIE